LSTPVTADVGVTVPVETPHPGAAIAWYGMAVLFLAQIVATMDRGILSFAVEPVRRDLGASDVQLSLLQGLAFAIFYATVGLPLGMVADRVSRRRLLIAGISVWSIATFLSGIASGFATLFACRLFVGLGEATLGPCAVSLIADLFPPSRRARPMSVYLFGGTISGGLAIMLTGALMALSPGTRALIPVVGSFASWRLTFMICGLLGLVIAALLIAMPEIARSGALSTVRRGLGIKQAGAYFATRRRLFVPLFVAVGLWTTGTASVTGWSVAYMMRLFGTDLPSIGHRLGLASMTMAVVGSLVAIIILPIVSRHGTSAKLRLAPALSLFALPAALLALAPDLPTALLLAAVPSLALPLYGSTLLSTLADLVPADMRGVTVALYAFCGTMIGATLGPLMVALLTEHAFADPRSVGTSIMLVSGPALLASSLLFLTCRRGLATSIDADHEFRAIVAANQLG
jgi:MFS family permease